MNIQVLLFHPDIDSSRVNSRLTKAIENIPNVNVRDMYDLYPDFKIDVEKEQALLLEADRIVLQFPMYWYSSPALLKQWEDSVLTHGWAYGSTGNKLQGKDLLIAVTSGASGSKYVRNDEFKYTVTDLLRPFQATNNLINTHFVKPFIVSGASSITESEMNTASQEYAKYIINESLESLGDYE